MINRAIPDRHFSYTAGLLLGRRIFNLKRIALGRLWSPTPMQDRLFIEERITIGPKKTLTLVNCAGRRFLVAAAGDFIAPLIEIGAQSSAARHADSPAINTENGQ